MWTLSAMNFFLSIRQNPPPLHDKNLLEIKDTKNIPKHNKSNIQQADSQCQIKWREIQGYSAKIRKVRLSTLFLSIQRSS